MTEWADVLKRIQSGDISGTADLLLALDARGKKEMAETLRGYMAERARHGWDWLGPRAEIGALRLAGAVCLGGAAAVTSWLFRRDLEPWPFEQTADDDMVRVLRERPEPWRVDLARRIVARLRIPTHSGDVSHWGIAARLLRETGAAPPESDALVIGWLLSFPWEFPRDDMAPAVAKDPLFPHLAPRIWEAEGLGMALADFQVETIADLVEMGRLERGAVLDGIVGRLLRDGPSAARSVTGMHERMAPTLEESRERATDYVRLLPAGPVFVAEVALAQVRRLDAAGLLPGELFAEAVEALAFRPESRLGTTLITWLGEVARRNPERADAGLKALAVLFARDVLTLQHRAARLALKLSAHAGDAARAAIAEAAAALPPELRDKVAAAYGAAPASPPASAAPLTASRPPASAAPVGSAEELGHEFIATAGTHGPEQFERLLAGFVQWAHRDPHSLREALQPWWDKDRRWFSPRSHALVLGDRLQPAHELSHVAIAFISPDDARQLRAAIAEAGRRVALMPPPDRMIHERIREVMALFEAGHTCPELLATPTSGTGHVDPDVLLGRMERLEAAGLAPLHADFRQALLRLPRSVDDAVVARAARLTSHAGQELCQWLREGGIPDPQVRCEITGDPTAYVNALIEPSGGHLPKLIDELCQQGPGREGDYSFSVSWWPAIMPSHCEVTAAHMVSALLACQEFTAGGVTALTALSHADGPVGVAMAYAMAIGMSHRLPIERAAAADALLTLAARGRSPSAEIGAAIASLTRHGLVKPNRVATVLNDAVQAGAHTEVWEVIAEALRALLPAPGDRPDRPLRGLADLIQAGSRAAQLSEARAEIPALAALAARGGSSRLVLEARRLHTLISP
ncbi:hypothetical protein J5X84_14190 [Streptosporangiaceae bacterium NEAU-GS5]|nr:hypothetical protein [Streptosporangiaceae bacterium NEAU-GS5]